MQRPGNINSQSRAPERRPPARLDLNTQRKDVKSRRRIEEPGSSHPPKKENLRASASPRLKKTVSTPPNYQLRFEKPALQKKKAPPAFKRVGHDFNDLTLSRITQPIKLLRHPCGIGILEMGQAVGVGDVGGDHLPLIERQRRIGGGPETIAGVGITGQK